MLSVPADCYGLGHELVLAATAAYQQSKTTDSQASSRQDHNKPDRIPPDYSWD